MAALLLANRSRWFYCTLKGHVGFIVGQYVTLALLWPVGHIGFIAGQRSHFYTADIAFSFSSKDIAWPFVLTSQGTEIEKQQFILYVISYGL